MKLVEIPKGLLICESSDLKSFAYFVLACFCLLGQIGHKIWDNQNVVAVL